MIRFTERLDKAIRLAAWAHEQAGQHRKGTDIPYIIHPFGTMLVAGSVTDDEDTLIACVLHDVLEDVPADIYSEADMQRDFGKRVVGIVKDVTKNSENPDWRSRSEEYLHHLETQASDQAVIVSASDKIHNLQAMLTDYKTVGDELWQRFTTKSAADQLWWYESVLKAITKRQASKVLIEQMTHLAAQLSKITGKSSPK